MKFRNLPQHLREAIEALKHGSNTIECDVQDALDNAKNIADFQDKVSFAMDNLIEEALLVKQGIAEKPYNVHVVIHLFEGILDKVVVHRNGNKAREDYEKRIIQAYGELVDRQEGKDEILMEEAEVVE